MMKLSKIDLIFYIEDEEGNEIEMKLLGIKDGMKMFTTETQEHINEMIATDIIGGD